jgi:hypothetical protein
MKAFNLLGKIIYIFFVQGNPAEFPRALCSQYKQERELN